jgi:deoxyribonuclease-4
MVLIGAHTDGADPPGEARERHADLVQFFLGDPQGWAKPTLPPGARAWRDAGVPLYVHAPYLINVASTNNRIRIPSRKILAQQAEAAAAIGARGLIVHGGHVPAGDDPDEGFANWRKTFQRAQYPLPILIENTAGGDRAMARTLDMIARLWDALDGFDVGFCLDTCHAHAGGEDVSGLVDRVLAVTGRIDLVHANDSKDELGSGRDRHDNLGHGVLDLQALVEVVRRAGAPVVVETPGGVGGQAADIAFLRARLGSAAGDPATGGQSTQLPVTNAATETTVSGPHVQV